MRAYAIGLVSSAPNPQAVSEPEASEIGVWAEAWKRGVPTAIAAEAPGNERRFKRGMR